MHRFIMNCIHEYMHIFAYLNSRLSTSGFHLETEHKIYNQKLKTLKHWCGDDGLSIPNDQDEGWKT